MLRKTLLTSAAFVSVAGIASAQGTSLPSFNVDIGSLGYGAGVPANTYAAAGPAAGEWAAVDADLLDGLINFVSSPLVDITGAIDRKIEALLAHDSQHDDRAEGLPTMIREWAQVNATSAGHDGRAIESFRVVHTE